MFAGLMHVVAVSLGSAGFLGFLSINASSIPMYIVAELISFAIAFALTFIYGKSHSELLNPAPVAAPSEPKEVKEAKTEAKKVSGVENQVVDSPVDGESIDLGEVNDQVFSTIKMMGDGAAIACQLTVRSMLQQYGEITVAYETKRKHGIKTDQGAEYSTWVSIRST